MQGVRLTRKGKAMFAKLAAMSDEQHKAYRQLLDQYADDPYSLFDMPDRKLIIGDIPESTANSIALARNEPPANSGRGIVAVGNPELFHHITRHINQAYYAAEKPDEMHRHTAYTSAQMADMAKELLDAAENDAAHSVAANHKTKRDRSGAQGKYYVFPEAILHTKAENETAQSPTVLAVMRPKGDGALYPLTLYGTTAALRDAGMAHMPSGKKRRTISPAGSAEYNRLLALDSNGIHPAMLEWYRTHR